MEFVRGGLGLNMWDVPESELLQLLGGDIYIWVFPNIGVGKPPKMDGENNGSKPYKNGRFGGVRPIFGNTHVLYTIVCI